MVRPSRIVLGLVAVPGGLVLAADLGHNGWRLLRDVQSPAADPAAAVSGLATGIVALVIGWLSLCLVLALAAELPGVAGTTARTLRDRLTPLVVRRWAAVVLGASVGATVCPGTAVAVTRTAHPPSGGTVTTATAPDVPSGAPGWTPTTVTAHSTPPAPSALPAPGFTPAPGDTSRSAASAPSPGWTPRRPPARQGADPRLLTGGPRPDTGVPAVVVHRGDTLWSIAATHLGPGATDVEISRTWPRWYAANRAVIGPDPDRLLPGTLLTPPSER